ncbi:MAG: hypothetical protein HYX59_08430 [Elusimicrobia bacterium]|nr:hypothetical protein [Elusimicrobiota bacterium]
MRSRILLLFLLSAMPTPVLADQYEDWLTWVMTSTMTAEPVRRFYAPEMEKFEERRKRKAEHRARMLAARNGTSYAVAALRRMNVPPAMRRLVDKSRGGLVKRLDNVTVLVPAAALPQSLELSVSHPLDESARETAAEGKSLSLASLPVAFGPEGTVFNTPVTITLPYDAGLVKAQGLKESDLKVHYWNPRTQAWEAVASRVDREVKTVSADVLHFSVYQVLGPGGIGVLALEADLGFKALYAFPNPIRGQGSVTIRVQPGLADSLAVRIYDVSGRKIHESSSFLDRGAFDDGNGLGPQLTYEHVWDISGVGSGVYAFVVTAKKAGQEDVRKTGKLAVIK